MRSDGHPPLIFGILKVLKEIMDGCISLLYFIFVSLFDHVEFILEQFEFFVGENTFPFLLDGDEIFLERSRSLSSLVRMSFGRLVLILQCC